MDDNERIETEEIFDEPMPPFNEPLLAAEANRDSIGLIWRVGAVVVALVIIAVLAFPLIQQRLTDNSRDVSPLPETPVIAQTPAVTLEATPNTAAGWFELGKSYYKANQWEQAVFAFQKTVELDPTYQAAYANLGAAYHRQDQLDLAATQYEKALELSPEDGEVVYNLAAIYLQQATQTGGQPDPNLLTQAVEQLHRALELAPDSAEPYFALGVAYAAQNQRQQAIEAFETFLARDTGQDSRASTEAQRYLEFLRGQ